MTTFAGEQLRIVAKGREYGRSGVVLTDDMVNGATLTILKPDATVLIDEEALTWDEEENLWFYKWDTDGLTPGTYKYRATFLGLDNKPSIEWGKARLVKQPTISS